MPYPTDYRYTREHEWISVDGAIGSIGITDYAQNSLGDIVYVDAPKVGDTVTANATFGSVESVKAVSDLFSPVSGKERRSFWGFTGSSMQGHLAHRDPRELDAARRDRRTGPPGIQPGGRGEPWCVTM